MKQTNLPANMEVFMGKKMGRRVLSSLTITAMTVVALLASTGCGMSENTPAGESKSTVQNVARTKACLLYTSPSPRD